MNPAVNRVPDADSSLLVADTELDAELAKSIQDRKTARPEGWQLRSAYGQVKVDKHYRPVTEDDDPWNHLRLHQKDGTTAESLVRKRMLEAERAAAEFKPTIRSRAHPLLKHIKQIDTERARKRAGVVRIEGVNFIASAIDQGWRPEALLVGSTQARSLAGRFPWLKKHGIMTVGTDEVVTSSMLQGRLEPALAIGSPPKLQLPSKPNRAMLVGIQDPNNLGSLIRSAAAFQVEVVYLLPGTPDPHNPAVLRASAGTSLMMPYASESDARACHLPLIAADAGCGESKLPATVLASGRFLLAMGHETRGLPKQWLGRGHAVTIPVAIESLGVAAAGAIMLDRLCNKRTDDGA